MTPTLPKRPRVMDQPPSIGWFDLPKKMRKIVINYMDPKTRCRFAQCSKLCEKEAKRSKNYMYKITLVYGGNDNLEDGLHLSHRKDAEHDFWLLFRDVGDDETLVIYKSDKENDENEVRWRKFESGCPEDVRLKYFNEYMEKYKNSIRVFVFDGDVLDVIRYNVISLKRLEKIDIQNVDDEVYHEDLVKSKFIGRDQFMSIKHLKITPFRIGVDQIFDFKGETLIGVSIGFNEAKMNEYLHILKNGESRQNLKHIKLEIDELKIKIDYIRIDNVARVMRGLDVVAEYSSPLSRGGYDYSEETGESNDDLGCYTFNFPSKNRENGEFHVVFEPRMSFEIKWKPTE